MVVFRSDDGIAPPEPQDFYQYNTGDASVVYATIGTSSGDEHFEDTVAPGRYRYRVCNHDAYFVYSDCTTKYWNGQGWLDSAAPLVGGWTRQLGMTATKLIGMFPGGHAAALSHQPDVTVLDLATGARIAAPLSLAATPSVLTTGTQVVDGRYLAFAADENGVVNAFDVTTGAPAWPTPLSTGESFTAGITGVTWGYGSAHFQANYSTDVLFVGSAEPAGNVVAIDATDGTVLWTLPTGSPVNALPTYDAASDVLIVPTDAGILAYDMATSTDGIAPQFLWQLLGATYTVPCVRTTSASYLACVDTSGHLTVLEKRTGVEQGSLDTGLADPVTLMRVSAGTPGFVVSNASSVARVVADATFQSVTLPVENVWTPGFTISSVLGFSSRGYLITAGNLRIYKLSSVNAQELSSSGPVTPCSSDGDLLGSPSWDETNQRYLFGTNEGRVWTIPYFE